MTQVFPQSVRERWEWLILDTYHKGHSFGEITAVNKIPSPFTVEVCSEKAILLKIHINDFIWHFGGEEGEPMMHIRSKIVMKTNWLRMKKQFLAYMKQQKLMQLDYRDDARYNALNPQRASVKEVSYMQNNPERQKEVTATSIVPSQPNDEMEKLKKDKIEQLKR